MNFVRIIRLPAAVGLIVASGLLYPPLAAADKERLDSQDVSELLADAKAESYELKMDAEVMATLPGSTLSWESHTSVIEQVKGHVNEVGRLVEKLNNARGAAEPWQLDAIDKITPLLKELADNTTKTIEYLSLNKERVRLQASEYKELVDANRDLSSALHALLSDFLDYGKGKSKFEDLKNKLEER